MQFPYSSQGFNRYTYVNNNPLSFTDPSGHFLKNLFEGIGNFLKKWARPIAAAVAAYVTFGVASAWAGIAAAEATGSAFAMANAWAIGQTVGGAAAGFVMGGIASGTWKGAVSGAVSGGIAGAGMALGDDIWGRMIAGGLNGSLQTETLEGTMRGMVAGTVPTDLWMPSLYEGNPFANFATGKAVAYVRGYITGGERMAQREAMFSLSTDIASHTLGIVGARATRGKWVGPKFQNGMYYYPVNMSVARALTLGNVVLGDGVFYDSLFFVCHKSGDYSILNTHEMAHHYWQSPLGSAYLRVHVVSQWPAYAVQKVFGRALVRPFAEYSPFIYPSYSTPGVERPLPW